MRVLQKVCYAMITRLTLYCRKSCFSRFKLKQKPLIFLYGVYLPQKAVADRLAFHCGTRQVETMVTASEMFNMKNILIEDKKKL